MRRSNLLRYLHMMDYSIGVDLGGTNLRAAAMPVGHFGHAASAGLLARTSDGDN